MANKTVKCDIWERQKGESPQAYEAFTSYRNMGPARSLRAVNQELSKSYTIIARWSSSWNWVERARAWDNNLEKAAKREAEKKVKEMTDRHIRIAMQLQKKALEELDALDTGALQPKEILSFIKEAANLERLSRLEQATGGQNDGQQSSQRSLADAMTEAYAKRKEANNNG